MSDQFTEQLSPYLDGELDDLRRARLEAHIAGCAECAAVLADLRAIVAAAPEYAGREPDRDLWAGIEAGYEADRRTGGRAVTPDAVAVRRSAGPPVRLSARPPVRRFSLPQLLAASIAMAALGSGSVWLALRGRSAPTGAQRIALAPRVDTASGRSADTAPVRPSAGVPVRPSVIPSFRPSCSHRRSSTP